MLILPPASAGYLDELQDSYITDISELPSVSISPVIHWQTSGHIMGWIDFKGFHNLSRDGEQYFILGDPARLAIVSVDAIGSPPGILDSLHKSVSFSQLGNVLTASLNVVMKYKMMCRDDQGSFPCGTATETATFQDSETIPQQFANPISELRIEKYKYINILNINSTSGILRYTVTTMNGSVSHRIKVGVVEYTQKGIPYMNLTQMNTWSCMGVGICNTRNEIMIENNTKFNISFETPYGNFQNTENITIIKARESTIEPYVYELAGFGIMIFAGIWLMKRTVR
jgi:hypothetical protein